MKRVFVSYSRRDLDVVTQLTQDMQAVGIDTWHDHSLTGGQRWWESILANIRQCDILIFALSQDSCDSEACTSELEYVSALGKTILPVLVADGISTNLLPHPFRDIQVTDYRRRDKEAAFALVRSINAAPPAPPLPDPLPAAPPVPGSYLGTLMERITSSEVLGPQEQAALLFDLEAGLRDGRSRTEVRDLLLRLKRRDDLLAKIAARIDVALQTIEDPVPAQPKEALGFGDMAPVMSVHNNAADSRHRPDEPRTCAKCRGQIDAGAKFCSSCGSVVTESGGANIQAQLPALFIAPSTSSRPNWKSRRYICRQSDCGRLIHDLKDWLDAQSFESQEMNTDNEGVLLQIKKRGRWRDFVGMSTSLNIVFRQGGNALTVEIGAGKWIDKAAVGVVSMVVLWPLAVTAGIGAWDQMKMPERIFDYLGTRLV